MTFTNQPYKMCTKKFKLEAIRLMDTSDKPATQIATELGLRRNRLYTWKKQMEKASNAAQPKRGGPNKHGQSETARLLAANRRLKEENEILKKAAVGSTYQGNTYTSARYRQLLSDNGLH
jgi:transposase